MKLINCVLIDDEPLALERMEAIVNFTDKAKVIKKINRPEEVVGEIREAKPDIVFLDVEMPGMSGFDLVKKLHQNHCFPTFVFVTGYDQYAIKAIKAEAFDYLLKPVDLDELNECLTRYTAKKHLINSRGFDSLSKRENEVQRLVIEGKTSAEIGEILFISKNTVDTHRRNIRKKLSNNGIT